MYADGYKRLCYSILVSLMINYEKQFFITNIEENIKYLICHILLKVKELAT